jgi:hypothetical protein
MPALSTAATEAFDSGQASKRSGQRCGTRSFNQGHLQTAGNKYTKVSKQLSSHAQRVSLQGNRTMRLPTPALSGRLTDVQKRWLFHYH